MADDHDSLEAAKARYEAERERRLGNGGLSQYQLLEGRFAHFDRDPWADPEFAREPEAAECEVVIVGGGFAGMMLAVALQRRGIDDIRIIEKGGDFGGTWYWNRYPGCMCDVDSLIYLPFLEETGYVPTERYASATEIFEHCRRIGNHFDLYPHARFQTEVEAANWDDDAARWVVETNLGDRLTTQFLATCTGILSTAKLPGIDGITSFEGHSFHTARWDYDRTGGSPTEPMDRIAGKRVGVIGTGATSVQVVPRLAEAGAEVFVFQRTPSAVGARDQQPIDPDEVRAFRPGWQDERMRNFTSVVTGEQPDEDLVGDGWSAVLWHDTQQEASTPEEAAELDQLDFEVMQMLRTRIDEVIEDPDVAERMKPWYGKHCKRICFHDEYLQAFNRPNVHLVDTDGRGVTEIGPRGPIIDGESVDVDLLVFASGFEVTTPLVRRLGFDPVGRDGRPMSERWADGAHTLHGVMTAGFPNLLIVSIIQSGFGLNFTHFLTEQSRHLAWIVEACRKDDIDAIEPTVEAEDEWLAELFAVSKGFGRYAASCTPSYGNSEGARDMAAARNVTHPGSFLNYAEHTRAWRDAGDYPGTVVRRPGRSTGDGR